MSENEFSPIGMAVASQHEAPTIDIAAASEAQGDMSTVAEGAQVEPAADAPSATKEPEVADRFARSFEKLSRQEMQLREREKAITTYEQSVKRAERLDSLSKGDKRELLRELGVSMDDLLKDHLNGGRPDQGDILNQLVERLDRLESNTKELPESTNAMMMAHRWDSDFDSLIGKDEYAIVREWPGQIEKLQQDVASHYKNTKQLLHPKTVLDTIAKQLHAHAKVVSKYVQTGVAAAPVEPVAPKASGAKTIKTQQASVPRFNRVLDEDAEMARIAAKYAQTERT